MFSCSSGCWLPARPQAAVSSLSEYQASIGVSVDVVTWLSTQGWFLLEKNANFSLPTLGVLIFPPSYMNHEHESWKTLMCHLLWLPSASLSEWRFITKGGFLRNLSDSIRNFSHAGVSSLPWEGNSTDLLESSPPELGVLHKNQTKSSIYFNLFSAVAPQAQLHFSFWLTLTCWFYNLAVPHVVITATTHMYVKSHCHKPEPQRSPCAHAHLLPNPAPTHMKSLSRGTSLLIHMSIKSI